MECNHEYTLYHEQQITVDKDKDFYLFLETLQCIKCDKFKKQLADMECIQCGYLTNSITYSKQNNTVTIHCFNKKCDYTEITKIKGDNKQ